MGGGGLFQEDQATQGRVLVCLEVMEAGFTVGDVSIRRCIVTRFMTIWRVGDKRTSPSARALVTPTGDVTISYW